MLTLRLTALYLLTTALGHSLILTFPGEYAYHEVRTPAKFDPRKLERKHRHGTNHTGRRPQRAFRAR